MEFSSIISAILFGTKLIGWGFIISFFVWFICKEFGPLFIFTVLFLLISLLIGCVAEWIISLL